MVDLLTDMPSVPEPDEPRCVYCEAEPTEPHAIWCYLVDMGADVVAWEMEP